jgi:hypothetical protein
MASAAAPASASGSRPTQRQRVERVRRPNARRISDGSICAACTEVVISSSAQMAAIGFLRPGLGIGGSERLALDAATQLQRRGCRVRFHIPDGAPVPEFPEVNDGAVAVERVRTWLPVHIGGLLRAPMAIARTKAAARALARSSPRPDLVFCDVVSHVVPLVKRLTERPVLFFCHFPDVLLTPEAHRWCIASIADGSTGKRRKACARPTA